MQVPGRQIFVYRLDTDDGELDAVSTLDVEWVFEHGLPLEAVVGFMAAGANLDRLAPEDFRENPAFVRCLSRVIYEGIDSIEELCSQAERQGNGYAYLIDGRAPDPGGRVVPEDIMGVVAVESGAVVRGSFEHNHRHRVLTTNGFPVLPRPLATALDEKLRARSTYVLRPEGGTPF